MHAHDVGGPVWRNVKTSVRREGVAEMRRGVRRRIQRPVVRWILRHDIERRVVDPKERRGRRSREIVGVGDVPHVRVCTRVAIGSGRVGQRKIRIGQAVGGVHAKVDIRIADHTQAIDDRIEINAKFGSGQPRVKWRDHIRRVCREIGYFRRDGGRWIDRVKARIAAQRVKLAGGGSHVDGHEIVADIEPGDGPDARNVRRHVGVEEQQFVIGGERINADGQRGRGQQESESECKRTNGCFHVFMSSWMRS